MQATIAKIETGIEHFIEHYSHVWNNTYVHLLEELKEDIQAAELAPHKVLIVLTKAMTAVKDSTLHTWQKKNLVIDVVQKIIANMPNILAEEKHKIHTLFLPALGDIFDVITGACKGHLFFYKPQPQKAKLGFRKRDAIAAPPTITVTVDITPLVDETYQAVRKMIADRAFTMNNLVSIGTIIMQVVDQYPNLKGQQKKDIVLQVAHNLVNEAPLDDAAKALINLAVDTTLNAAIEFIIMAKNGEIEFVNKIEEKLKGCCLPKKTN
jgi:hypothetical protein